MPYHKIEVWQHNIERAKKAKTWLPSITKECNTQIARLEEAGGKFNLQKVEKIRKALAYLTQAIELQQAWCVTEFDIIYQEPDGPDIGNVIYYDFSNFEKAMKWGYIQDQSDKGEWGEKETHVSYSVANTGIYDPLDSDYEAHSVTYQECIRRPKPNVVHCSLQDALNLSPSNLFNFGLFGGNGSYGTMWGKTKELAEVEKNAKSAMSI